MKKLYKILWILVIGFIWGNSLLTVGLSEAISIPFMNATNSIIDASTSDKSENTSKDPDSDDTEPEEESFLQVSLPFIRKTAHVLEFAALGALTMVNFMPKNKQSYLNVFFFGFSVAFLDETIQIFVEGRGAYVQDVWFDLLGVVLGMVFVCLVNLVLKKRNREVVV